jgi:hypothetical protein
MPFSTRPSSTLATPLGLFGNSGPITRHSKIGQIVSAHADDESENLGLGNRLWVHSLVFSEH